MVRKALMSILLIVGLFGAPLLAAPSVGAVDVFGGCKNSGVSCSAGRYLGTDDRDRWDKVCDLPG